MASEYRSNHYVPIWYQKRFVPRGQHNKELYRLDLRPSSVKDSKGKTHTLNAVRRLGFKHCFVEPDLYTTQFGNLENTEIERFFFGPIDSKARGALDYFASFDHRSIDHEAFHNLMLYLSIQKLRTPKGLAWLSSQLQNSDRNAALIYMQEIQHLHSAIWTECIWQIASAAHSETKFLVSDHPVSVYNRRCGPRSIWCRGFDDPSIAYHATHTLFPLSLDKILLFTNLSWARNPYQSETGLRPNPNPWRSTFFSFLDIQIFRELSEQEVREINFIIKSRAFRYVAAAREDWLFPERHVSKSDWSTFGHGYLLMPDPRSIGFGGEIVIGYQGGRADWFDPYGHRPWQSGFEDKNRHEKEWNTFQRFRGEFARLFGPCRRGRAGNFGKLDNERDDDDFHHYNLSLESKYKRK